MTRVGPATFTTRRLPRLLVDTSLLYVAGRVEGVFVMPSPTVNPVSLEWDRISFAQDEHRAVRLGEAPSDAMLTTKIVSDGGPTPQPLPFRLEHVIALRMMRIPVQDYDRAPGVPAGEQSILTGVVVGQSDGTTPLSIKKNDMVQIGLVAQLPNLNRDRWTGALLISGDSWDPISVPLSLTVSDVNSIIDSGPLTIQQGDAGTVSITAQWLAGPDADVSYSFVGGFETEGVTMDQASVLVPQGETKTVTPTIRVKKDALVGTRSIRIRQDGGGTKDLADNLHLQITPAPVPPPKTGPTNEEIAQATVIIDKFYRDHGGISGPFGWPLKEVEFNWGIPSRRYAGGKITIVDNRPKGSDITWVQVRFVGFHSWAESNELSDSDEPYFIIEVAGTNTSNTRRFGPYDHPSVDAGNDRFEAALVASSTHTITPPIVIGVVAMENDEGTPEEAEAKVRSVIEKIEGKFNQATGVFSDVIGGRNVLTEWARAIFIGWVPEVIGAVFGLGDDTVGQTPLLLFDNKADLEEWVQPPVIGKHGLQEYTHVIPVGSEGEGQYDLFFKVDLIHTSMEIQG
jgi:hypothetical protein